MKILKNMKFIVESSSFFNKRFVNALKPTQLIINHSINNYQITAKNFSQKDDNFWEEYSKMKARGGRYPALESQEIIYNKTVHSWKYADKHALTSDELFDCLKNLKKGEVIPFLILDVRESHELEIFELPKKTRKDVEIPIKYKPMEEINHGNYEDLPMDKYIICIDYQGLLGRRASQILYREGFLTLYVHGGYDMFLNYAENKEY